MLSKALLHVLHQKDTQVSLIFAHLINVYMLGHENTACTTWRYLSEAYLYQYFKTRRPWLSIRNDITIDRYYIYHLLRPNEATI